MLERKLFGEKIFFKIDEMNTRKMLELGVIQLSGKMNYFNKY